MRQREFEMRRPVSEWILSRKLTPILEVWFSHRTDLVGISFEIKPLKVTEIISVELKTTDIGGVLSQCDKNLHWPVNEVWAAIWPTSTKNIDRFFSRGIGLLFVDDGEVRVIHTAPRREVDLTSHKWKRLLRRRDEYLTRIKDPLMRCDLVVEREQRRNEIF